MSKSQIPNRDTSLAVSKVSSVVRFDCIYVHEKNIWEISRYIRTCIFPSMDAVHTYMYVSRSWARHGEFYRLLFQDTNKLGEAELSVYFTW